MIRGVTEGELSASRLGLNIRDEYRIGGRAFVFGQNQYLRDAFKKIVFLLAPTGGIGYKVLDTDRTKFSLDAGIGGVWEKNTDMDVRASGAVTLGERYSHALTPAATLTQSFSGVLEDERLRGFAPHLRRRHCGVDVHANTTQGGTARQLQEQAAGVLGPEERRRRADGDRVQGVGHRS